MASDGLLDMQGAVYNVLNNINPPLSGGRIFDYVQDNIEYPFVRIGDSVSQPNDVDGFSGTEEFLNIDVFSKTHGKKELKEITAIITNVLHRVHLTTTDRTAQCWLDRASIGRDQDGITHRAIMRFKIISFESE